MKAKWLPNLAIESGQGPTLLRRRALRANQLPVAPIFTQTSVTWSDRAPRRADSAEAIIIGRLRYGRRARASVAGLTLGLYRHNHRESTRDLSGSHFGDVPVDEQSLARIEVSDGHVSTP
jgi:hypothetical protein